MSFLMRCGFSSDQLQKGSEEFNPNTPGSGLLFGNELILYFVKCVFNISVVQPADGERPCPRARTRGFHVNSMLNLCFIITDVDDLKPMETIEAPRFCESKLEKIIGGVCCNKITHRTMSAFGANF